MTFRCRGAPSIASDSELRRRIYEVIRRQPWGPLHSVTIVVRKGRVDLWGTLFDGRTREALRVAVENAGAREYHDHMIWLDPMTGTLLDAGEEVSSKLRPIAN